VTITDARFDNSALSVAAGYDGQTVTLDATLDSLGRFVSQLPGPVKVSGTVGLGQVYDVNLRANGPGGIALTATGSVSKALVPDLAISGTAPLGVANAFLPNAVDVQGNVALDLGLTGQLGLGGLGGRVTISGGRASVPAAGLALTGLEAQVSLSGGQAQVNMTTGFSSGGTASLQGSVGLTNGTPIDLTLTLNGVGAVKEPTFRTTLNGTLALTGSLASGGRLSGTIELGETEVSLAFSSAEGTLIDIEHRGAPPAVTETRRRAGLIGAEAGGSGTSGGGQLALDVTISAPNRVFVRGRGLDAELGGQVRLTGRAGAIVPIGQFELIRGRLDILGKRLDLSEATLTLEGSFDPVVRLVATTTADDVNIQIVTEGTASAPRVSLQSSPDLPPDEVLALLLFGKGLDKISAIQALQLANAVATLIGPGGEGLQGKLRKQFGLDDLDVTTDENGSVALKAGKYLSENVYTDVTVNAEGEAEIQLNLDITPNLTARGKVGGDGGTSLGIFFEKDY
jgi:translocation and assembly module TamB